MLYDNHKKDDYCKDFAVPITDRDCQPTLIQSPIIDY